MEKARNASSEHFTIASCDSNQNKRKPGLASCKGAYRKCAQSQSVLVLSYGDIVRPEVLYDHSSAGRGAESQTRHSPFLNSNYDLP